MKTIVKYLAMTTVAWAVSAPALAQFGNPSRGERDFRACVPRQALEPAAPT